MKDVPREALAALQKDGASQIDHYIYGHPKTLGITIVGMTRRLTVFSFLFVAASPAIWAQHARDIQGFTLGMPYAAAKAKLGPQYKTIPLKSDDAAISSLVAYTADRNDVWSIQAINEKVVYLLHMQEFPKGSQPLDVDVFKSLTAKYGENPGTEDGGVLHDLSSFTLGGRFTVGYAFDENGNPLPWGKYALAPNHQSKTCTIELGAFSNAVNVAGRVIGSFPGQFYPGCHQILQFTISRIAPYVLFVAVDALDSDAEIREAKRLQELEKVKKQKELDDAKKIKIPL